MWWRELRAAVARPLPTSPPTSRRSPRGVVVLVLLVVPFAVAVSALSFRTGEPRYLVPAFPLLACSLVLVGAGPAPDGAPSWWRRPAVSAGLAAVLVVASASTTVAWLAREAGARHGGPSAEECYDAAADALAAAGVRHVAGSYWQVQPLDLAGRGRLDVRQTRIKDEFAGTMPAPDAPGPWALAADGPRERALFASVLTGGGHTFTATSTCAGLTTFTAITPALTPSEVADPRFYNWFGN